MPRGRWLYICQHVLVWTLCGMTLVAGIFAFAYFLFELTRPERPFIPLIPEGNWISWLPWIWVIGALLSLLIATVFFAKTERGYRVAWYWIL